MAGFSLHRCLWWHWPRGFIDLHLLVWCQDWCEAFFSPLYFPEKYFVILWLPLCPGVLLETCLKSKHLRSFKVFLLFISLSGNTFIAYGSETLHFEEFIQVFWERKYISNSWKSSMCPKKRTFFLCLLHCLWCRYLLCELVGSII